MSLNVSVMAVLHTSALPAFPGHLCIDGVFKALPDTVQRLLGSFPSIRRGVQLVMETDLQPEFIRVPLDVQRQNMRSLQWLPYAITEKTVSSQADLLDILCDLESLRLRTRRVLPLLVDMDIHYRIMKLMYGESLSVYDYGAHLAFTPILYGVCHTKHVENNKLFCRLKFKKKVT